MMCVGWEGRKVGGGKAGRWESGKAGRWEGGKVGRWGGGNGGVQGGASADEWRQGRKRKRDLDHSKVRVLASAQVFQRGVLLILTLR